MLPIVVQFEFDLVLTPIVTGIRFLYYLDTHHHHGKRIQALMTSKDLDGVYQTIAHHIIPDAKLIRHWPLTGGVSAHIEALEMTRPDGGVEQVVVRRQGDAQWKHLEDNVIANEFALQSILFQNRLQVPEPLLLDLTGSLLPSPFLVMAMVSGTTVITDSEVDNGVGQMGEFLARLHSLDLEPFATIALPEREDPISGALEYLPITEQQRELREVITHWKTVPNQSTLLHGDFWPGNILWQNNQIAAVIDWEDAAIGTPVSDLACARAELTAMYGEPAMETFTTHYLSRSKLDTTDLALWDVYVSASALATMADWGLTPEVEAVRRKRTSQFLNRAGEELISRAGT